MTQFRGSPTRGATGPREVTADMRADADHSGRFLRLFGAIWMGVCALVAVLTGVTSAITQGSFIGFSLGGGMLALGLLAYLLGFALRRRSLAVFERGVEARAVITEVFHDFRVRMNGKHPWRVRYRYAADGAERIGTATFWTDHRPEAEVGDEVTALYLPGSPSRTVLWSRLGVWPPAERIRVAASNAPRIRVAERGDTESSGDADAIAEEAAAAAAEAESERAAKIAEHPDDRDSDAKGSDVRSSGAR